MARVKPQHPRDFAFDRPDCHFYATGYPDYQPHSRPRLFPTHPHPHTHHPHQTNAYETTRPTNRYQPSRGAQRDAKWLRRHERPIPTTRNEAFDRIRAEQVAAIARARAEIVGRREREEEEEKKVRRIQLQVFVHARETRCSWKGCEAVLNSWALLEKHVLHAHLYPGEKENEEGKVWRCEWDGCGVECRGREEVYRHCLVRHMGEFSARCPFDCLFSGPSFPLLMAHITRRHPLATPDDFLPGLIHHAPHLPPSSNLPALPHFATIPATVEVGGYKGEVVSRAKRLVSSRCLSGRRPRKDRFEEKKGAMGAIGAVVENARRIIVAVTTAEKAHENDDQDDQGVDQGDGQVPTSARTDIQLLDVVMSATGAREDAQREVGGRGDTRHAKGISNGLITEAGSTSVESSLSPAQSAISWAKVSPTNAEIKRQQEPTSATQRTAEGVKRSERLRERERRSSVSPNSALVESPVS